ncbi:hypothetical protein FRC08_006827 [Ceratobasidium sp. 394]|nr:hypothetical protein FRC08_006827 [Ceratobasidium sp. 394]KAG9101278.1 hypothetical protein FS749_008502 [Ceratobasidium sp. UAMH 11750]
MSRTNRSTSNVTPQDIIVLAEREYYVGRFTVDLKQVLPHPHQRPIDPEWVMSLFEAFEPGIDRAAHPIKALIDDDAQWETLAGSGTQLFHTGAAPGFPLGIALLVYHGQHRVQACKKLPNPEEHWWFVDVYYRKLEQQHPAEFLSLMHAGNESPMRLECREVDRFLGLLHLLRLKEQGQITTETFQANKNRLVGPNESVRRGLSNLTRDLNLANAIGSAIQHPQLRPTFNAASWRKLTKGRFYQLAADLIAEMEWQSLLLRDNHTDVSPKPFQLPARVCSWKILKENVKAKDHPWHELPGGPPASMKRVQERPSTFRTKLNPGGGWVFPDMVLLPSVLTSHIVTGSLEDMYDLAQHLVHMVAGPEILESYTSNKVMEDSTQHPAGIIAAVAGDRIMLANGQPSGFPHKVGAMWNSRVALKEELAAHRITDAAQATRDQYQILLQRCSGWWSIMRLFKIRTFTTGLKLTVPSQLDLNSEAPAAPLTGDVEMVPASEPGTGLLHRTADGRDPLSSAADLPAQSHNTLSVGTQLALQPNEDEFQRVSPFPGPPSATPGPGGPNSSDKTDSVAPPPCPLQPAGPATTNTEAGRPNKRARLQLPAATVASSGGSDQAITTATAHSSLDFQARRLLDMSPTMDEDEAKAMAKLVKDILDLKHTGIMFEALEHVQNRLPKYVRRAERMAEASYEDTEEE